MTIIEDTDKLTKGWEAINRIPTIQYEYNQRKLVFEYGKLKLYHYAPKVKQPRAIPLLVVFATVNRPEILDLFPEKSFIGELLASGLDVYLVDWGYPDYQDKEKGLGDYVIDYLHHAINFVVKDSNQPKIDLLGICQGGIICLSFAILFRYIKNLVLISTPIDFQTEDNMVGQLLRKIDINQMVDLIGNIPGQWLTQFFISLRPFELVGQKYLRFYDHLGDDAWVNHFLRVEKWLNDAPDQTGASFAELVNELYHQNKLIKGEFYLSGQHVDLKKLTIPVLNVMAEEDEIVPVSASKDLGSYCESKDYSELIFPSGHIGIYVSDKVGKTMPHQIAEWLKLR